MSGVPRLDGDQRRAVTRERQDVCVVAGPGSGKTRVLTERYAWLVTEKGVEPERILAITFTEKAAAEIKGRLLARLGTDADRRRRLERAYISTIHGFCSRLLREHAVAAGVDIGFRVIEEAETDELLAEAVEEVLDRFFADRPDEARRLMDAIKVSSAGTGYVPDLAGALTGVYQALRAAGWNFSSKLPPPPEGPGLADLVARCREAVEESPAWYTDKQREEREALREWMEQAEALASRPVDAEHFRIVEVFQPDLRRVPKPLRALLKTARGELSKQVLSALATEYYAGLRQVLADLVRSLDETYSGLKLGAGRLDFTDLEQKTKALLETDAGLRRRVQEQFDHILMDELQDTNPLQWEILELIRRPGRFFAVGDINQSIYGFRYAEPELFRSYRRKLEDSGLAVDEILSNYRTRKEVLDAIGWLAGGRPGLEIGSWRAAREEPVEDPPVEVAIAFHEDRAEADRIEALWIANRIRELAAAGRDYGEIAVLARKSTEIDRIAGALRAAGIPYGVRGGKRFFACREVRDVLALVRAIANTGDEVSLAALLRSPLAGLSMDTIYRARLAGGRLWGGLYAMAEEAPAELDAEEAERVRWLVRRLLELRAIRDEVSTDRLAARVLDETGYLGALDAQGRANVEKLLRMLREQWEAGPPSIAAVVEALDRKEAGRGEAEAVTAASQAAVSLMTIHAAKGLEFPVVFVAALHAKPRNTPSPISYSKEWMIGACWVNPHTRKGVGDLVYEAVRQDLARRAEGEEWRLLYVAMTRAEDRLILSWAQTGEQAAGWAETLRRRLEIDVAETTETVAPVSGGAGRARVTVVREAAALERFPEALPRPPEAPTAPRPRLTDQYDAEIPVTHVVEYAVCPRRYYLERYLEVDPGGKPQRAPGDENSPVLESGEDATEVGVQVHQILAGSPPEDPAPEAVALAESFRTLELAKRMERARRLEREFDFLVRFDPVLLRGQIDAWFETEEGVVLVDYKTDRFDPDREPERLRPYELQLRLYAQALEPLLGAPPARACLCFLRTGKVKNVSLKRAEMEDAARQVARLIESQESLDFPLAAGAHCYRCPFYRGACPAKPG